MRRRKSVEPGIVGAPRSRLAAPPPRRAPASLVVAAFVLLPPLASGRQALAASQLSQGQPLSFVTSFRISPDGGHVVYEQDAEVPGRADLWSVSLDGGAPVRLATRLYSPDPLEPPIQFAISPDGQRVVYALDKEQAGDVELYSVPIGGPENAAIKLSVPIVDSASEGVNRFRFGISPEGSRVVFTSDALAPGVYQLYSAPIAGGGGIVTLNDSLVAGGDVGKFEFSPVDGRVVYLADEEVDEKYELYSVPQAGGTRVKIVSLGAGLDVVDFRVSPQLAWVVYKADQRSNDVFELFGIWTTGGIPAPIHDPLPSFADVDEFSLTPLCCSVVFVADASTDAVEEIFEAPMNGGIAARLNPPVAFGDLGFSKVFTLGSSSRVVFSVRGDLWSARVTSVVTGSVDRTQLNPDLVSGGSLAAARAKIATDGARVVYIGDQETDEVLELFSVPIAGGASTKLNPPLVAGGNVTDFEITPDSKQVVYMADQSIDDRQVLRSVPTTGGSLVNVNDNLVSGGDVIDFAIAPNGVDVVYLADQETDGDFELFLGSICIFCNGFDGGTLNRWSGHRP